MNTKQVRAYRRVRQEWQRKPITKVKRNDKVYSRPVQKDLLKEVS